MTSHCHPRTDVTPETSHPYYPDDVMLPPPCHVVMSVCRVYHAPRPPTSIKEKPFQTAMNTEALETLQFLFISYAWESNVNNQRCSTHVVELEKKNTIHFRKRSTLNGRRHRLMSECCQSLLQKAEHMETCRACAQIHPHTITDTYTQLHTLSAYVCAHTHT